MLEQFIEAKTVKHVIFIDLLSSGYLVHCHEWT